MIRRIVYSFLISAIIVAALLISPSIPSERCYATSIGNEGLLISQTETCKTYDLGGGKFRDVIVAYSPDEGEEGASKDNYMNNVAATTNYGTQTYLLVGDVGGYSKYRALAEFELGDYAGVDITYARLDLYYYNKSGSPGGNQYNAHRLLRLDWSELGSCWNNYKSGSAWTIAGAGGIGTDISNSDVSNKNVPGSYGWMSWNVEDQVQWAATNEVNAAFRIAADDEGTNSFAYFYSSEYTGDVTKRPRLVIYYEVTAPQVTTSACSNIYPTKLDANGEVIRTGGAEVTSRGFCYRDTEETWLLPTSHEDDDGVWSDETLAYNDNTSDAAYTDWDENGHWLELYRDAVYCDKLRVYVAEKGVGTTDADVDIQVEYDGGWHTIWDGSEDGEIPAQEWTDIWIGTIESVTGAQIMFNSLSTEKGYVYELQFNNAISINDDYVEDDEAGVGAFSTEIDELTPETTYYIRAFAENEIGIGYGNIIEQTTPSPWPPTVDTDACSDVGATTMTGNADIEYYGGETVTTRGFAYTEGLKYSLDLNGSSDYVAIPYHADYYSNTDAVEDFEWSGIGHSISESGGSVTWTVTAAGGSYAQIDTGDYYQGTRSAEFFRDGSNSPLGYFSQTAITASQFISFWFRKDGTSHLVIDHGNGSYRISVFIGADEHIYYYDGSNHDTGETVSINTWYTLSIRNVNWSAGTYDIYLGGSSIKSGATMQTSAAFGNIIGFRNMAGTSFLWLDNILVGAPSVWTYEVRINRKADNEAYERILWQCSAAGTGAEYDRFLQLSTTGTVWSGFKDTAGVPRYISTTDTIPLNTDIDLAASFDGTYIRIYIKGILKATSGDLSAYIPRNNKYPIYLGRMQATYNFEGTEDEIRIWEDVRTQTEIAENMYSELDGDEAGLVGYWKCNEGADITLVDSTSNENDGTITGADWMYQSWDLGDRSSEYQLEWDIVGTFISNSFNTRAGQRLTIEDSFVSGLSFALYKIGSPTGDITFTIRDLDNNVLASVVWGDASSLGSQKAWETACFDAPIYIDEEVRILTEFSGGDGSNIVVMGRKTSDVKADEVHTYYQAGWTDNSGQDAAYIYGYFSGSGCVYEDGSFGDGEYDLDITGLLTLTWYRVQGFAINDPGIGFGDVVVAQTDDGIVAVDSVSASSIGATTATLTGNLTDTGGSETIERGFQWGTETGVYPYDWSEEGAYGTGTYSHNISGLSCNTNIYWRAFAVGVSNTDYGDEMQFTTLNCSAPAVTNSAATGIGTTYATLHGYIVDTGGMNATLRGFEWGYSTGVYSSNWTEGGNFGVGNFSHQITGLTEGTQVFWRALAVNIYGQGNSTERSFYTVGGFPGAPTNLTATLLTLGTFSLNWTKDVVASLTVIRIREEGYPRGILDGELLYSGNGTSTTYNLTANGWELDLENTTYFIRAWSWNSYGYSLDYAQTTIGGEMVIFVFFGIVAIGLTLGWVWKREGFLAWGAAAVWLLLGFTAMAESTSPSPAQISDVYMGLFWLCIGFTIVCAILPFAAQERTTEGSEDLIKGIEGEDLSSMMDRSEESPQTKKTRPSRFSQTGRE